MLDELKDIAVGMRTLPLSVITGPFPRAVRDFARAEGKAVNFVVTGPDTELDRVILESLSEPLGHLLRNAVNHGIESPEERERAGKPPRGRIEVRAVPRRTWSRSWSRTTAGASPRRWSRRRGGRDPSRTCWRARVIRRRTT